MKNDYMFAQQSILPDEIPDIPFGNKNSIPSHTQQNMKTGQTDVNSSLQASPEKAMAAGDYLKMSHSIPFNDSSYANQKRESGLYNISDMDENLQDG